MSNKANPTRIGLFVVLSALLLVTGITLFGGGKFFSNKNIAIVYFDGSLQGLNVGAPVAYQGITIGEIKEIQLDINTDTFQITIPVLISLIPDKVIKVEGKNKQNQEQDINTFLKTMCDRGLRATVKTQSLLTGKLYIDLAIHPNSVAIYHSKDDKYLEIPTVPSELQQLTQAVQSLNFMELAAKFSNTMDALEKMSTSMEQALGSEDSRKNLTTLFASLEHIHSILAKLDEGLFPLIAKLDTSLNKAAQLSDNTNQMIRHIDGQIDPFFLTMNNTVRDTGLTMQAAETLMTDMRQSTGADSPLYYQLTESINELGKAASAMRAFTDYLDRNPQSLLFGTDQQGESSK
jgi:paraquat-inducible protein B